MDNTNKKYIDILNTAKNLFWKHGFRRISVEEICLKAGVSKMTFYRFFPNKTELAKTVYTNVVQKGMLAFKAIMNEKITSIEKIKKIMLMKLDGTNDISHEFMMDFYSRPELGLKDFIEEKTKELWTEIIEDFKKAQQDGVFRKDFKPELIFSLSQRIVEMASDKTILRLYNNQQELIMELVNFFVFGISPHK